MRESKPWGWTETLHETATGRVDRIGFRAGEQSSGGRFHRHPAHDNLFVVTEGRLTVDVLAADGQDAGGRTMGAGQSFTVPAGLWHRFTAETDGEAVEVYTLAAPEMTVERQP